VNNEMERRLHDLAHRLEQQGVTIAQYLALTGQEQQPFVDALRASSTEAVRADLALRAVVAQESIAATDDEVDSEVERLATQVDEKPERVRKDLERRGGIEALRSDLARGKALRFLIDHADVVDPEGNPVDLTLAEGEPAGAEPAPRAEDTSETAETAEADPDRTTPTAEEPPE
jgi:trigger factor